MMQVSQVKTPFHCIYTSSSQWFHIVDTGQPRAVHNREVEENGIIAFRSENLRNMGSISENAVALHVRIKSSLWFQIVDTGQPRGVDSREMRSRRKVMLLSLDQRTPETRVSLAEIHVQCISKVHMHIQQIQEHSGSRLWPQGNQVDESRRLAMLCL